MLNFLLFLTNIDFIQSKSDYSFFIRKTKNNFTVILVYVDEIILVGNCLSEIKMIKEVLNCSFKIKDHGEVKYFLGLKVSRANKGIHLCQRKYTLDTLNEIGMLGSKPHITPLMTNNKIIFEDVEKLQNL